MELQEIIDIRYEQIEGLQQKLSEDHYMTPDQEDELEELITKAIKFGELCAQRDAKSQVVPEGFVLVPIDVADRCISHIALAMCHPNNSNAENDVMQMDLDILESRVEAQEQSHE